MSAIIDNCHYHTLSEKLIGLFKIIPYLAYFQNNPIFLSHHPITLLACWTVLVLSSSLLPFPATTTYPAPILTLTLPMQPRSHHQITASAAKALHNTKKYPHFFETLAPSSITASIGWEGCCLSMAKLSQRCRQGRNLIWMWMWILTFIMLPSFLHSITPMSLSGFHMGWDLKVKCTQSFPCYTLITDNKEIIYNWPWLVNY